MKKVLIFFSFLLIFHASFAQDNLRQTIRGNVIDQQSQAPLSGVNVIIAETDPVQGAVTDNNGYFRMDDVPVGRHDLIFSMIGYHPVMMNNLSVISAKELVMVIEMEEKITDLEEVVVKAPARKDQPINEMALISARSFTIEETERYAGSFSDPSRMVSNYAGVVTAGDQRNDIIIRGNSPLGLLWRLEGTNIPNPNHFGTMGTTGGPISILNNNLLTNSDFFTGAFPAEYGNALSGAFDLKMRNGNTENREYIVQMGFNGFELGAEGPFSRQKQSSYLIHYRYTMMDLMNAMGLFDVGGIPKYQDLSFKLNFPGQKAGQFTLFGIGGYSHIDLITEEDKSGSGFVSEVPENTKIGYGSNMGCVGMTHQYFFRDHSRLTSVVSYSFSQSVNDVDSLRDDVYSDFYYENYTESKINLSSEWSNKINARNQVRIGGSYELYYLDYLDEYYPRNDDNPLLLVDLEDNVALCQTFAQWTHRFNDKIRITAGLHGQYFDLNNSWSVEPRISIKSLLPGKQSISLGYGLHSQLQPRIIYFVRTAADQDNTFEETNSDLGFSKSHHFVAGYDIVPVNNFRIKIETYYQYLFDIPVEKRSSVFSMLNYGAAFYNPMVDSLVNEGTGENMGIELTIEKFFTKNYYFLITASLYDSKYTASDGNRYNTAFNGNYTINVLAGYEFNIGKNVVCSFNLKNTYAGGKRYIPVDSEKSMLMHRVVYNYDETYTHRYDDYYRIDIKASLQLNQKRVVQEWAFEIQNVTDHKNIFTEHFDYYTGEMKTSYQIGFFPIMSYKLYF
jgi:hypothetical protein